MTCPITYPPHQVLLPPPKAPSCCCCIAGILPNVAFASAGCLDTPQNTSATPCVLFPSSPCRAWLPSYCTAGVRPASGRCGWQGWPMPSPSAMPWRLPKELSIRQLLQQFRHSWSHSSSSSSRETLSRISTLGPKLARLRIARDEAGASWQGGGGGQAVHHQTLSSLTWDENSTCVGRAKWCWQGQLGYELLLPQLVCSAPIFPRT